MEGTVFPPPRSSHYPVRPPVAPMSEDHLKQNIAGGTFHGPVAGKQVVKDSYNTHNTHIHITAIHEDSDPPSSNHNWRMYDLPVTGKVFVGREQELRELDSALDDSK